ncbi:hypothetical protein KDX36_12045, partial [Pseudomonas sp. CDFA 611]|nr:hypothetical protein [Pseudomonas quasicaspiana]
SGDALILRKHSFLLERGLPAKNDDAVYLLSLGASFAGKPRSNRSLSLHATHYQITDEPQRKTCRTT